MCENVIFISYCDVNHSKAMATNTREDLSTLAFQCALCGAVFTVTLTHPRLLMPCADRDDDKTNSGKCRVLGGSRLGGSGISSIVNTKRIANTKVVPTNSAGLKVGAGNEESKIITSFSEQHGSHNKSAASSSTSPPRSSLNTLIQDNDVVVEAVTDDRASSSPAIRPTTSNTEKEVAVLTTSKTTGRPCRVNFIRVSPCKSFGDLQAGSVSTAGSGDVTSCNSTITQPPLRKHMSSIAPASS
jgi:hypothetical protein